MRVRVRVIDRVGSGLGAHCREHHQERREDVDAHTEWDQCDDADGKERARNDGEELLAEAGVRGKVKVVPVQREPPEEEDQ